MTQLSCFCDLINDVSKIAFAKQEKPTPFWFLFYIELLELKGTQFGMKSGDEGCVRYKRGPLIIFSPFIGLQQCTFSMGYIVFLELHFVPLLTVDKRKAVLRVLLRPAANRK